MMCYAIIEGYTPHLHLSACFFWRVTVRAQTGCYQYKYSKKTYWEQRCAQISFKKIWTILIIL